MPEWTKLITLTFSEQEGDEEVVLKLSSRNPQVPVNVVRFDHSTGEYVQITLGESMIDHFEIQSTVVHKDSAEGKKQVERLGGINKCSMLSFHVHILASSVRMFPSSPPDPAHQGQGSQEVPGQGRHHHR